MGEHVVLHLVNELNLEHHQLFFDNFFTTLPLLLQLQEKRIGATGTIRRNRKFVPKELLHEDKLQRGEYRYYACDQISVVKWQDKKTVFIASNSFDPRQTETVTRRERNGSKISIPCPAVVSRYNKFMRGVDLFDQRIARYSVDRKSRRNWIRIFLYLLRAALSNAFVCYNDLHEKDVTYAEFLCSVSMSLISDQSSRKRRGRPVHLSHAKEKQIQQTLTSKSSSIQLLAHMPVAGSKGRCRLCSTKAFPVFSTIKCSFCGVALCVKKSKNCFLTFHQKLV